MRIGYLGDGPWAHRAIEALLAEPDWTVVFIGARHPGGDAVLQRHAGERALPFYAPVNINAPDMIEVIRSHRADVIVSMSYNQIIRQPLIDLPPKGFINCHAGMLPFYRGRNILNWALINGETSFGVTVHYVDAGIDTGDIIHQVKVPIAAEDDYGDVLEKAFVACPVALTHALRLIAAGTAPRIPQTSIHPTGFYCGRRIAGDEVIDWSWTAARLHNFVRGVAPPAPGARTSLDGRQVAFLTSEIIDGTPPYIGTTGEVVGRDARGIVVKCSDTVLRITSMAEAATDGTLARLGVPRLALGARFR
jgi:methionyl-tRNA formyltransferase